MIKNKIKQKLKNSFEVNLKVKTHTKRTAEEVENLIFAVLKQYFYEGTVKAK